MIDKELETDLSNFITEDHGVMLKKNDFVDHLLQMLENIPGFECLNRRQIKSITRRTWIIYDKDRSKLK